MDKTDLAPHRPPPLNIGPLQIAPPVLLAPMSGITNPPMRTLCEEAGCGLTITEFIAAPALVRRIPSEMKKLQASVAGKYFGVQIFGSKAQEVAEAARIALSQGAALVDINMGCPARRVVNGTSGAALMKDPALAASLVRAANEVIQGQIPLTVKIRSGWDEHHQNAPEFAAQMVEAGAQAITIHGRTRLQAFTGRVNWDIIARVKQAVSVPVIGNGDVTDVNSLEQMFTRTGCDGVMIGRGALGNPWIFAAARAWWLNKTLPSSPQLSDRLLMYRRHLELYLQMVEERQAVLEMRKFAGWYLKGFAGAANLRKKIYELVEAPALRQLITMAITDFSAESTREMT